MKQKVNSRFILSAGISLFFLACNQNDKKTEETKTTDSTGAAKTEVAQTAAPDPALDAVKVAPDHYKVVSDTLGIRVLEVNYKPGESSALHAHPDNALYVISGGSAEFTEKDGAKHVNEMKSGMALVQPGNEHSVKNTGTTNLKAILVEVNRPNTTVSPDASMDATKIAPDNYKVVQDTMGIRILEVNYKPGQSSSMHSHPDYVVYVAKGGTAELTAKDGTKQVRTLPDGVTFILPGETHSAKITGSSGIKLIMVEVTRPVK